MKTVIIKWRKYGTTVTLPRTGCPSKIDEKTRRKLVREASKRHTATLKALLASTGCILRDNNLPYSSYVWAMGYGGKTEAFSF